MENTNCINCGAPLDLKNKICRYCGTAIIINKKNPLSLLKFKKFRVKGLYPLLLFSGLAVLFYIYGIAFNTFSETLLIQITPLWFFPIVFGSYGYFAEFLMSKVVNDEGKSISDAYNKWINNYLKRHIFSGMVLTVLMLPFSFLKFKNSLLIALTGSMIWGVLLIIFFNGIFPAL